MLQGDRQAARAGFEEAIATGHLDITPIAMLALGEILLEQDDHDSASSVLREAIASEHPDAAPRAMVALGQLLSKRGDAVEALGLFRDASGAGEAMTRWRCATSSGAGTARCGASREQATLRAQAMTRLGAALRPFIPRLPWTKLILGKRATSVRRRRAAGSRATGCRTNSAQRRMMNPSSGGHATRCEIPLLH
jgi:hypothetical protein